MKLLVIEVMHNGQKGYLRNSTTYEENCVVDNPLTARNYRIDPECSAGYRRAEYIPEEEVKRDLQELRIAGKPGSGAFCGVCVESADIVEFEVELKEVDRKVGKK